MVGEGGSFAGVPRTCMALVSVRLGLLAGGLGTMTRKKGGGGELGIEMEMRSMTGAGAGEAPNH